MDTIDLKEIKQLAAKARGKWLAQHSSEELITKKVEEILEKEFLNIVIKYIKPESLLNSEYSSNTAVRLFKEYVGRAIENWSKIFNHKEPEINESTKVEITKLYNAAVLEGLKNNINRVANEKSIQIIENIIDEYTKNKTPETV